MKSLKKPEVEIRIGKKVIRKEVSEVADKFADYAILSANIYLNNLPSDDVRVKKDRIPLSSQWQSWSSGDYLPVPTSPNKKRKFIRGLDYEVWTKDENNSIKAVIVFRGTDFNEWGDWRSNFRWIWLNLLSRKYLDLYVWDQYHQVQALVPQLIKSIQQRYKEYRVVISATGHSLGGGLAQQAAYCCSDIKEVVAFDPSPVTGYMDIDTDQILLNQHTIQISRVYQEGEVLSYLRSLLRQFYPLSQKNPEIIEYQLDFIKGNLITRHGMALLAKNLKEIAEEN